MTASGNPPEVKPPGIQLLFAPDSFPLGQGTLGQGTVPCPILSMCRNVDFIQGAGKIIPRALVVGFNWAFHRGTENRPLSHREIFPRALVLIRAYCQNT